VRSHQKRSAATKPARAWWSVLHTVVRMYLLPVEDRYKNPTVLHVVGRDARWLERALKVAAVADGRWRVGCVIVRGGRVLAAAANTQRNDPANVDGCFWHVSVHAEMAALRQVADPRGATAYVARIGRSGEIRHSQPCIRCREVLEESGVRAVWSSDASYVEKREHDLSVTPQKNR
jgi:tRNA(Arg) A34 adenosine deaminase TadA